MPFVISFSSYEALWDLCLEDINKNMEHFRRVKCRHQNNEKSLCERMLNSSFLIIKIEKTIEKE